MLPALAHLRASLLAWLLRVTLRPRIRLAIWLRERTREGPRRDYRALKLDPWTYIKLHRSRRAAEHEHVALCAAREAGLPVPHTIGPVMPFRKLPNEFGSLVRSGHAVLTNSISARPLWQAWSMMDEAARETFHTDFRRFLSRLRGIPHPLGPRRNDELCALDGGPHYNIGFFLDDASELKPRATSETFVDWLCAQMTLSGTRQGPRIARLRPILLGPRPWQVVCTHGDLQPKNLLVDRAGHLTVVDWEQANFMPEWCEYSGAKTDGRKQWSGLRPGDLDWFTEMSGLFGETYDDVDEARNEVCMAGNLF